MKARCLHALLFAVATAAASPAADAAQLHPSGGDGSAPVLVDPPAGFVDSCRRYAWLCSETLSDGGRAAALVGDDVLGLARRVNRWVNFTVAEITDAENYGVPDYWTLPRGGRGDCEDFVLEKYRRLLEAGVPGNALSVAVVLDREGENHAVLILHHASGDYVLDNLTSRLKVWNETGYTFLAMQSHDDPLKWEVVQGRPRTSPVLARH